MLAAHKRNNDYKLPIQVIDHLSPTDEELIVALDQFSPSTRFKPGDLAALHEIPPFLRLRYDAFPRFWKVRFVLSTWAHEMFKFYLERPGLIRGFDQAVAIMEANHHQVPISCYRTPMVYAHAYPHGQYPDSAAWLPERCLRKVQLREQNAEWPIILDEAKAPLVGYDLNVITTPFVFDLAPDNYKTGECLGRPFSHEEATFHTACLLGLEELMVRPAGVHEIGDPRSIDPDHDIYAR